MNSIKSSDCLVVCARGCASPYRLANSLTFEISLLFLQLNLYLSFNSLNNTTSKIASLLRCYLLLNLLLNKFYSFLNHLLGLHFYFLWCFNCQTKRFRIYYWLFFKHLGLVCIVFYLIGLFKIDSSFTILLFKRV